MIDRAAIAREAMRSALQVRRNLAIAREQPVNPFEIAEALGIDVWFTDTPSLEGMYTRTDAARIFLPCLQHRPFGRVSFTCAHELGHSQLGHGDRVDQYLEDGATRSDPEEIAADVFASTLLMPRPAVLAAFHRRGLEPRCATGIDLLTIAFELCVGLATLIKHLHWGLGLIDEKTLTRLSRLSPKSIRATHFGDTSWLQVAVPIDAMWRSAAIDLEVGHALAVPKGLMSSHALAPYLHRSDSQSRSHDVYIAAQPGQLPLERDPLRVTLRIARAGFQGQWRYRYLEEVEAV